MLITLYNTERYISMSCDSFNTIRQVVADLMGPQVGSDFKSMQNAARIYATGHWDSLMPDSYEKFSQLMTWGMRQHILLDQVDADIIDFLMQPDTTSEISCVTVKKLSDILPVLKSADAVCADSDMNRFRKLLQDCCDRNENLRWSKRVD